MSTEALRAPLKQGGIEYDPQVRQIVLFRTVLVQVVGVEESRAQSLVTVLQALNKLRVHAAHSLEGDIAEQYRRMGMPHVPHTPRAAWDGVVEAVVRTLEGVTAVLVERGVSP